MNLARAASPARAIHDVGLAVWFGGSSSLKFAMNPALESIADRHDRGAVANRAWNSYNVASAVGLGAATVSWFASRGVAAKTGSFGDTETALARVKDVLMIGSVATGAANAYFGAKLYRSADDGAVPVESGTAPAAETPPEAARYQRILDTLGNVNLALGAATIAVTGWLSQETASPKPSMVKRVLL